MAEEQQDGIPPFGEEGIYREETFTDRRVGTIQVLTPVTADGSADPEGTVLYYGQTQVMTPAGPLPLTFELPGGSLSAAAEGFPAAAQQAVEDTQRRLEEMRREQASSLIVPGQSSGPQGGPGGLGGPGGGIQIP